LTPVSFPLETKSQDVRVAEESWSEIQRLASIEAKYIVQVYKGCNRNKAQTARKLGISYPTIKRKLKSLGIE